MDSCLRRLHEDGAAEAGIYAAGFRLLDAFNMVGFLMAGFLLPFISRHWPDLKQILPGITCLPAPAYAGKYFCSSIFAGCS